MPKFILLKPFERTNIKSFLKEGKEYLPIPSELLGFEASNFNCKIYKRTKTIKIRKFVLRHPKLGYIWHNGPGFGWTKIHSRARRFPTHRIEISLKSAENFAGRKLVKEYDL